MSCPRPFGPPPTPFRPLAATAAALALLAAACADPSTAPRSAAGGAPLRAAGATGGTSSTTGLPPRISNTVKYRDKGAHPATGRSGSATLTARALLAKDGTTLVELTTGTFDAGTTPPGNLSKVQLKQQDPSGVQIGPTVNYTNLKGGGYASYTLPGLGAGFQVQAQANITGIDPRTDVATVITPVVRRPDLAVTAFRPPPVALANTPVTFTATVQELNGDVGARANCVLYVDGAAADQAKNIWVDAKGTVTCAFSHTFTTAGQKALKVAVEQVTPGDWDLANNAATGTVTVVTNNASTFGYAYDATFTGGYTDAWSWTYGPDPSGATAGSKGTWQSLGAGHSQGELFFGRTAGALVSPSSVAVSVSSGGTPVYSQIVSNVGAPPGTSSSYLSATITGTGGAAGTPAFTTSLWIEIASGYSAADVTADNPDGGWTAVTLRRDAGAATYQSEHTGEVWYKTSGGSTSGSWTVNATSEGGALVADPVVAFAGSDVTMQVAVTSAAGTSTSVLTVPLVAFDVTGTPPFGSAPACTPTTMGYYTWTHCYTNQQSRLVGRGGWAVGAPGSTMPVVSGGWF